MPGDILTSHVVVNYREQDKDEWIHFLTHVEPECTKVEQLISPSAKVVYTSKFNAWYMETRVGAPRNMFVGVDTEKTYKIEYKGRTFLFALFDSCYITGSVMILLLDAAGVYLYTGCSSFNPCLLNTEIMRQLIGKQPLTQLFLDNTYFEKSSNFETVPELTQRFISVVKKCKGRKVYIHLDDWGLEMVLIELAKEFKVPLVIDQKRMSMMKVLNCDRMFTCNEKKGRIFISSSLPSRSSLLSHAIFMLKRNTRFLQHFRPYMIKEEIHYFTFYCHNTHKQCCEIISTFKPELILPVNSLMTAYQKKAADLEKPKTIAVKKQKIENSDGSIKESSDDESLHLVNLPIKQYHNTKVKKKQKTEIVNSDYVDNNNGNSNSSLDKCLKTSEHTVPAMPDLISTLNLPERSKIVSQNVGSDTMKVDKDIQFTHRGNSTTENMPLMDFQYQLKKDEVKSNDCKELNDHSKQTTSYNEGSDPNKCTLKILKVDEINKSTSQSGMKRSIDLPKTTGDYEKLKKKNVLQDKKKLKDTSFPGEHALPVETISKSIEASPTSNELQMSPSATNVSEIDELNSFTVIQQLGEFQRDVKSKKCNSNKNQCDVRFLKLSTKPHHLKYTQRIKNSSSTDTPTKPIQSLQRTKEKKCYKTPVNFLSSIPISKSDNLRVMLEHLKYKKMLSENKDCKCASNQLKIKHSPSDTLSGINRDLNRYTTAMLVGNELPKLKTFKHLRNTKKVTSKKKVLGNPKVGCVNNSVDSTCQRNIFSHQMYLEKFHSPVSSHCLKGDKSNSNEAHFKPQNSSKLENYSSPQGNPGRLEKEYVGNDQRINDGYFTSNTSSEISLQPNILPNENSSSNRGCSSQDAAEPVEKISKVHSYKFKSSESSVFKAAVDRGRYLNGVKNHKPKKKDSINTKSLPNQQYFLSENKVPLTIAKVPIKNMSQSITENGKNISLGLYKIPKIIQADSEVTNLEKSNCLSLKDVESLNTYSSNTLHKTRNLQAEGKNLLKVGTSKSQFSNGKLGGTKVNCNKYESKNCSFVKNKNKDLLKVNDMKRKGNRFEMRDCSVVLDSSLKSSGYKYSKRRRCFVKRKKIDISMVTQEHPNENDFSSY